MQYASNGKGNLGVTLGAIGTGLGVLGGTSILSGMNLNGGTKYVTSEEMKMSQQLANKDSQIALLKAEQSSQIKMTQVYKQSHAELVGLRDNIMSQLKELEHQINQNRRDQDAWNASQSVANAQMSAAIATNANSIASINNILAGITQIKVPNTAVCPGWGNVTITPANAAATT